MFVRKPKLTFKVTILFIVIIIVCSHSCTPKAPWKAQKKERKKSEQLYGTASKRKLLFHSLAWLREINPRFDGVLFCYEAVPEEKLSRDGAARADEKMIFGINPDSLYRTRSWHQQANQTSQILGSHTPIVLTHSFSTIDSRKSTLYNIYDSSTTRLEPEYNLYENSIKQLVLLRKQLDEQLQKKNYTHIVLMAHGWNNEQEKAIFHYNEWLTHIREAAGSTNGIDNFQPFYVAITWPSFISRRKDGGYIIADFFIQANNADEIGMTHMNYMLWQVLEPLANKFKTPLLAFGHSLGARMLSRASYALEYTPSAKNERVQQIDCFIGFQSAYRIERHLQEAENTGDGNIYSDSLFKPWRQFISTSSTKDGTMKIGRALGVFMGHNKVIALVKGKPDFVTDKLGPDKLPQMPPGPSLDHKLVLLDATEIIGHHQDVNNADCGRMIWYYIRNLRRN